MNLLCFASEDNRGNYLLKWINYLVEGYLDNSRSINSDNTMEIITIIIICIFFLLIITFLIITIHERNKTIKKYIDEKNKLIKICQEKNKLIKELQNTNQQ